ncbi:MAG: CdaR family protein, partial [Actinomycetota bacterium]|nr:CdaR family protein [Actinomycetota bacterium]
MTRVLRVIVHNWPLKLAAIGLATLLYGGLVLSSSQRTFPTVIPITVEGQPDGSFMLTVIEPVTEIRYFSASGVQPIASDFRAHIDISHIEPGSDPQSVPVQVDAIDPRIRVLGVQPQNVTVDLDELISKEVDVTVPSPIPPPGLTIGDVQIQPARVLVSGPSSVLSRVVGARADVSIQSAGLDFDQDVQLIPIDELGNAVGQVSVEPKTARITVPVFSNRETRQLPISPLITGDPAAGFELVGATVEPKVVTVEGDADQLSQLVSIDTEPISVTGLSSDRTCEATLALPTGVAALDVETVVVSVDVRIVTATRTFEVGLRLVDARNDLIYDPAVDRVVITVGGSVAELDRLDGATLVADLDVGDMEPGVSA